MHWPVAATSFSRNWGQVLLNRFFRKQRILGLDLGSHSLKWVLLELPRRNVYKSGELELLELEESVRHRRIEELLQQLGPDYSQLVASQSARGTLCGYAELPPLSEAELAVACQAEALGRIPYPAGEARLSFQQVAPLGEGTGVFFTAERRHQGDRLLDWLENHSAAEIVLDSPPAALARAQTAFEQATEVSDFDALLDLGYSGSWLVLSRAGSPYYARHLPCGAQQLVYGLQMAGRQTAADAGAQLRRCSPSPAHALGPPLSKLVRDLERSLTEFGRPVARLTLSGGGAQPAVADYLGQNLSLPVVVDEQPRAKLAWGLALR